MWRASHRRDLVELTAITEEESVLEHGRIAFWFIHGLRVLRDGGQRQLVVLEIFGTYEVRTRHPVCQSGLAER